MLVDLTFVSKIETHTSFPNPSLLNMLETYGLGTTGNGARLPDPAGLSSRVAPAYNLQQTRGPQHSKLVRMK